MFRAFQLLLAIFAWTCSALFGDIQSTRTRLGSYSNNHPAVLDSFDRVSTRWLQYNETSNGKWELEKLLLAVEYAAEKHEGQTRKDAGATPYIFHPIGVAEILWNIGEIRSVNVLTAALLHDTLEDTNATPEEIWKLFGSRVCYTVSELTNDPSLSTEDNKQRQVDHAPEMSLDGQLVKLADRLYNIRDLELPPPSWSKEKVDGYYAWGEKLLAVLQGTNSAIELALQQQIDAHKPPAGMHCKATL